MILRGKWAARNGRVSVPVAGVRWSRSVAAEPLRLLLELGWGDPVASGLRAGMQPRVPGSDDQFGVADGQDAGEVDGVGSAECMGAGELARVPLDRRGELDRPGC
jgi:hypothetical protein